tara:strand:+ start:625 stop:1026 length:402 start_codon:yes stop_codon:yes gene_type:complete
MDVRSMNMRSHLSRVRGLGANHIGVHHFWVQRITAIALIPLMVWFMIEALQLVNASHEAFVFWVGSGYNPVLLGLLIVFSFYHGQLGLQVIIEDYVRNEGYKITLIITIKLFALAVAICSLFSIMRLTFKVLL